LKKIKKISWKFKEQNLKFGEVDSRLVDIKILHHFESKVNLWMDLNFYTQSIYIIIKIIVVSMKEQIKLILIECSLPLLDYINELCVTSDSQSQYLWFVFKLRTSWNDGVESIFRRKYVLPNSCGSHWPSSMKKPNRIMVHTNTYILERLWLNWIHW
jgi:hypothetical protein